MKQGIPVMVTTDHRGVFAGLLHYDGDDTVVLDDVYMCVYWSPAMRGIFGLVSQGPDADCKISRGCQRARLLNVTSVTELSPDAWQRWQAAPWS